MKDSLNVHDVISVAQLKLADEPVGRTGPVEVEDDRREDLRDDYEHWELDCVIDVRHRRRGEEKLKREF